MSKINDQGTTEPLRKVRPMRALVTGCTGNVGRATANLLHNHGWHVVGVARSVVSEVYETHPLDLTRLITVYEWMQCRNPFDLVVMAHGIQRAIPLSSPTFYGDYQEIIDSHLTSSVYLTYQLANMNLLNPGSLIVYCSSIQATQTRAGRLPYGIAKAGIEALTRGIAIELAPDVRAVALRLGQLSETMAGITFTDGQMKAITDRLPLPLVKSENVASLILALYGQTEMSGCVLDVDSGHSLNIWP